jgi:hypothetical protein
MPPAAECAALRPGALLYVQFVERFWHMFGMAPDTRGLSHLKVLILAVYAAGLLTALCSREIRRHAGYRTLLVTGGVTVLVMMAIDNESHYFYLVHFVLWLIAFTAISAVWYWDRRGVPRWALAACWRWCSWCSSPPSRAACRSAPTPPSTWRPRTI